MLPRSPILRCVVVTCLAVFLMVLFYVVFVFGMEQWVGERALEEGGGFYSMSTAGYLVFAFPGSALVGSLVAFLGPADSEPPDWRLVLGGLLASAGSMASLLQVVAQTETWRWFPFFLVTSLVSLWGPILLVRAWSRRGRPHGG